MNFEEMLARIVNGVEGAISAILMGFDGIAVANYVKEKAEVDIEALAVEYTRTISEVTRTANAISAGNVREISLATQKYSILFSVLPGNYFVALLLKEEGNLGKGRYVLKMNTQEFASQL